MKILTITALFVSALLSGCATAPSNNDNQQVLLRCPRDSSMMVPIDTSEFSDANGQYVVTTWQCPEWQCGWTQAVTNRVAAR